MAVEKVEIIGERLINNLTRRTTATLSTHSESKIQSSVTEEASCVRLSRALGQKR